MERKKLGIYLAAIVGIFLVVVFGVAVWEKNKGKASIKLGVNEQHRIPQEDKKLGEEKDKHGCMISEGYFWCEEKQDCFQDWKEKCGNINSLDISKWETFNSKNNSFKFKFKYPSLWFNQGDISSGYGSNILFFSKDSYSRNCNENLDGRKISCKQDGQIALVEILLPNALPKKVAYEEEQKRYITIDNYKALIIEGKVNDVNGGYIADDKEKEIRIFFSDLSGVRFMIAMKLENDSDKEIFNGIISTLEFN